uniref:Uncharacterized protein n=1 Tax=Lepeophtheirus salmonis TaxID=72036 RepID=A0A0K2UG47_LEPSM
MMWFLTRTHTSLFVSDQSSLPSSTRPKLRHIQYCSVFRRRTSVLPVDEKGIPNSNGASFADDSTAGRLRDSDPIFVANVAC